MVRNSVRSLKCCVAMWVGSVGVGDGAAAWGATLHNKSYKIALVFVMALGGCSYKTYYVKYALGLFLLAWFFALSIWRTCCTCGGSLRGYCGQGQGVWRWQFAKTMTAKKRRVEKSGAGMCAKEVRGTSTIAHMPAGAWGAYLRYLYFEVNRTLFRYRAAPMFLIFTSILLASFLVLWVISYISFTGRCHFVDLLCPMSCCDFLLIMLFVIPV